jgi:hypothetical protein
MKADAQAIYQASSRSEAVAQAQAFARRWQGAYPQLAPGCSGFAGADALTEAAHHPVFGRCFVEVRRRTRPMVCFVNVQSVKRMIFTIFNGFKLEWRQHTLRQFTRAA